MAATIGSLFHRGGEDLGQWLGLRGAGGQSPRPRVRDGTVMTTSSRPQRIRRRGRPRSRRIEAAILSTNSDEGQARDDAVLAVRCYECLGVRLGRRELTRLSSVEPVRRFHHQHVRRVSAEGVAEIPEEAELSGPCVVSLRHIPDDEQRAAAQYPSAQPRCPAAISY